MKVFSKALLAAALASLTEARRGRTFESDAFLSNKRGVLGEDPYLAQNAHLLNLR